MVQSKITILITREIIPLRLKIQMIMMMIAYWYIDLETNGSDVHYKIDTGAQANVIPLNVY